MPVPHAFCAAPQAADPEVTEQSLPVFVLRGREQDYTSGARVEVETSGWNASRRERFLRVRRRRLSNRLIHIIDAREVSEPLRAIRFDWSSPDGVSEVKVRIEASDDLDRWQTIVPASTLLLAQQGDQELRRERIQLPRRKYEYLRVQRVDGGPPLAINSVTGGAGGARRKKSSRCGSCANRLQSNEADVMAFDAAHVAPVTYARFRLPRENSSVGVTIQSRTDEQSPWHTRWSGESYIVVTDTTRRESPPARFEPTTDRLWRVQIQNDAQLYQGASPGAGLLPGPSAIPGPGSGAVHGGVWQPAGRAGPFRPLRRPAGGCQRG